MTSGTDQPRQTIARAREQVEAVASDEGPFGVACKETGRRPAPVSNTRFQSYEAAELACLAARSYRDTLRELDPSLPAYDLTVCEIDETNVDVLQVREQTGDHRDNGLPKSTQSVTLSGGGTDEWLQVDNGPVVDLCGPDSLLDDEFVSRQLESTLENR